MGASCLLVCPSTLAHGTYPTTPVLAALVPTSTCARGRDVMVCLYADLVQKSESLGRTRAWVQIADVYMYNSEYICTVWLAERHDTIACFWVSLVDKQNVPANQTTFLQATAIAKGGGGPKPGTVQWDRDQNLNFVLCCCIYHEYLVCTCNLW